MHEQYAEANLWQATYMNQLWECASGLCMQSAHNVQYTLHTQMKMSLQHLLCPASQRRAAHERLLAMQFLEIPSTLQHGHCSMCLCNIEQFC